MLFADNSTFKLQRFPQLIEHLQTFLESSFEDVFAALPEKWNQVLEGVFDLDGGCSGLLNQAPGGRLLRVEQSFTRSGSGCEVTWDGKQLGQLLLLHLVSRGSHLVSFSQLQRGVYEGVEAYFRRLEGAQEALVEDYSEQRREIEQHINTVEGSIQGILRTTLQSSSSSSSSSNSSSSSSSSSRGVSDHCTTHDSAGVTLREKEVRGESSSNDGEEWCLQHGNTSTSTSTSTSSDSGGGGGGDSSLLTLTLQSVGLDIALLKASGFSPKHLQAGGFSALEAMRAGEASVDQSLVILLC
jgi:hypothetical protein